MKYFEIEVEVNPPKDLTINLPEESIGIRYDEDDEEITIMTGDGRIHHIPAKLYEKLFIKYKKWTIVIEPHEPLRDQYGMGFLAIYEDKEPDEIVVEEMEWYVKHIIGNSVELPFDALDWYMGKEVRI